LEFRERFWEIDVEKPQRPLLDPDQLIQGGHSVTTDITSQIVYPTPRDYVFPKQAPFVDWDFSDTRHSDDNLKSGVLVSYTWDKQAERLAAFDSHTAMRTVLRDIANLHSAARYPDDEDKRAEYIKTIKSLFVDGKIEAWGKDSRTAGAFVLFGPFQYGDYLQNLMTWPEGILKIANCNNVKELIEVVEELKARASGKIKEQIQKILGQQISSEEDGDDQKDGDDKKYVNLSFEMKKKILAKLQDRKVYFCGEAISWCNGWIQGALESAVLASYQLFDNYQTQHHETYIPPEVLNPDPRNPLMQKY